MVIVVFAEFFIVFYDSTTSIFPRRVSQLHRHSCLGKRPVGPSGRCYLQRIVLPLTRAFHMDQGTVVSELTSLYNNRNGVLAF